MSGAGATGAGTAGASPAPPHEPGPLDVLAARLLANVLLSRLYRRYVEQMGLRGGEQVLDFGSGTGAAARHIAPRLSPEGRLVCVDVSERWLRTARRAVGERANVEFLHGDVRTLGLPEGAFDVVLVHWMLHDVAAEDRTSVVAELACLLRPGGRLFSREPTGARHGMPAAEARRLFGAAGLTEILASEGKARFLGTYYRAVWIRPAG